MTPLQAALITFLDLLVAEIKGSAAVVTPQTDVEKAKAAPATPPPATEPKKAGRPKKDPAAALTANGETIPGPGATPAETWTHDKLRTLARECAAKTTLDQARAAVGGPIDGLKPEDLPGVAAKLRALIAGGKPEAKKDDDFM